MLGDHFDAGLEYLRLAQAAQRCSAFFTSVLLLEKWHFRTFGQLKMVASADSLRPEEKKGARKPLSAAAASDMSAFHNLLMNAYKNITDEPDSMYGVVTCREAGRDLFSDLLIAEHEVGQRINTCFEVATHSWRWFSSCAGFVAQSFAALRRDVPASLWPGLILCAAPITPQIRRRQRRIRSITGSTVVVDGRRCLARSVDARRARSVPQSTSVLPRLRISSPLTHSGFMCSFCVEPGLQSCAG